MASRAVAAGSAPQLAPRVGTAEWEQAAEGYLHPGPVAMEGRVEAAVAATRPVQMVEKAE